MDYLVKQKLEYFDMTVVHLRECRKSKLSREEYISPYEVGGSGHYNPEGNNFFAYSIKDTVVKWLDPKPMTHQQKTSKSGDFKEYLFNGENVLHHRERSH